MSVDTMTYISGDVSVALSANDGAGAGVEAIFYRVNGSSWESYISSIPVTQEGMVTIDYYAEDRLGNTEGVKTAVLYIDNTAPEISAGVTGKGFSSGDTVYLGAGGGIELSAADAGSGVDRIVYELDAGTGAYSGVISFNAEGAHALACYALDRAGNVSPRKSFTVYVDTTMPLSSCSVADTGGRTADTGIAYVSGRAPFALSAVDPLSGGVSSGIAELLYAVDSGSTHTVAAAGTSLDLSTLPDGFHIIRYRATDRAQNVEPVRMFVAVFDRTKPVVRETYPANGARLRAKDASPVRIAFSEPVECADWTGSIVITETKQRVIANFTVTYDTASCTLLIGGNLKNNTVYDITVPDTVTDRAGNALDTYHFSFTTHIIAKEGGTVPDETAGLTLNVPPESLPCDGYFEMRVTDYDNPLLPQPLEWLLYDGQAFQILFRDADGNLVREELKEPCELIVWLQANAGYAALQKKTAAPVSLKLYQVGKADDAVAPAGIRGPAKNRPNATRSPLMLSAAQVRGNSAPKITAKISSFGMFNIARFAPPANSLDDLSCYPNPFDPSNQKLTIQYYLADNSDVGVVVYDLMGNLVKTWKMAEGETNAQAGLNQLVWDGKNGQGDVAASGGYIVSVHADGQKRKFKVLVVK
jgi:hypothetical protein